MAEKLPQSLFAQLRASAEEKGLGESAAESFDQNIKSYAERFSGVFAYESQSVAPGRRVEVHQRKTHIGGAVYSAGVVLCRYMEALQVSSADPFTLQGANVRLSLFTL